MKTVTVTLALATLSPAAGVGFGANYLAQFDVPGMNRLYWVFKGQFDIWTLFANAGITVDWAAIENKLLQNGVTREQIAVGAPSVQGFIDELRILSQRAQTAT